MRALTADRKAAAMTQAAVAAQVHQTLDVHRGFATQVAFNLIIAVDGFADLQDLSVSQLIYTTISRNNELLDDFLCEFLNNHVNIRQRNNNALCSRDVDASDTCHAYSPCVPVAIRQEAFR